MIPNSVQTGYIWQRRSLLQHLDNEKGSAYRVKTSKGIILDFAISNSGRRFERREDIKARILTAKSKAMGITDEQRMRNLEIFVENQAPLLILDNQIADNETIGFPN